MAKKGGTIQETLKINIVTQLDNIDQTVKTMRDSLSNLNLGASTQKEFNQILSGITEKIKNLRATTKDGVIKFADQNQVAKDIKAIEQKLQRLGIDTDFLSVDEKNLQKSAKVIEQMTAERRKYAAAVEEANKKEQAAQERVNNWQIRKNNISQIVEGYNTLASVLVQATQKAEITQQALKDAQDQLDSFMASDKNDKSEAAQAEIQRLKKNLSTKKGQNTKAQNAVTKAQANFNNYDLGEFENINKANKRLNEINESLKKAKENLAAIQQQDIGSARFEDLKKNLESIKDIDWSSFGIDFSKIQNIEDFNEVLKSIKDNSGKGAEQAIEAINKALQSALGNAGHMGNEMEQVSDQFDRLASQKRDIDSLRQSLLNFFGIQNAIQLFKRAVREAYESVTELDKAMTETAVVTDFSVGDMWDQLPEYTKMANDLGTTTLGAYETATLFYQQGLKTNEVMEVSVETMKMARIAGMDYVDATNMMTAALRGFNMEISETSAQRVNDVYSELAKITASDTQEISTAMTKTASIAHNANMEFETTAAFLSQIIETTRESAETAGTAMKTIIARFTELKKNPNELVEVDGEQVDANKIETALRSVGVALRDSNGEFRKLDDVFLDLAKRWDSLTVNQQRYVATMAAGSRQQSRFIAMMSDYDRTVELVNAAYNSAGSSQEQFEKTTESLESKINRLHNAWQEFTMNLSNNAIIKGVVDLLTGLLNIINKITTVGDTMNNSVASFALTLGVVIKTFTSLGKAYDKYGDKVFNGIRSITSATKIENVVENVKKGTEQGTVAAQQEVYETTKKSIYRATKEGMTQGAQQASTDNREKKKVKVKVSENNIESTGSTKNKTPKIDSKVGENIGKEVGEKVEAAIDNSSTTKETFGQSIKSGWKTGWNEGKELNAAEWERFNKNLPKVNGGLKNFKNNMGKISALGKSGAQSLSKSISSFMTPMNTLLLSVVAINFAIKGVTAVFDKLVRTSDEQVSLYSNALAGATERIQSLSEELSNITQAKDKFNELTSSMDHLTEGTIEYEEARRESNTVIRDILEKNPNLSTHVSYQAGQWTPDSSFWSEYQKATENALKSAEATSAVLQSKKASAEYDSAIDQLGVATTDITTAEQETAEGIATATGIIAGALGVLLAPVSGGLSLVAVAGASAATGATVGALGTAVSKFGKDPAEMNKIMEGLAAVQGANFTEDQIKRIRQGNLNEEDKALAKEAFGGDEKALISFFKQVESSTVLNKAIAALENNTAALQQAKDAVTGGDPDSKYYYSDERMAADASRADAAVMKAVDWVADSKEQSQKIEGTGKTVGQYLDDILKDRDGYSKDSKGRWTYQGKLLNLNKENALAQEISAAVAADFQKAGAEAGKAFYNGLSEQEKRAYKTLQVERQKAYQNSYEKDFSKLKSDYTGTGQVTNDNLAFLKKYAGIDVNTAKGSQKYSDSGYMDIIRYISGEAEKTGQSEEALWKYYNQQFDLENMTSAEFFKAVQTGLENSTFTILTTEQNTKVNQWADSTDEASKLQGASEDARKAIYQLGTTFEGEGKTLAQIFNSLGDKADDIFADADLTSKEGIEKFVQSLQNASADTELIQQAFGVSLDELSDRLLSMTDLLPSVEQKATSAAEAYTLANQIAQDAMMSFSQAQYDLITKMDSDLSDAFFKIGDAFYYTEGSAYQLAQALSTAATEAVKDYEKILNRKEGIGASDYNKLTDDQKKNWEYNKKIGKYEIKPDVSDTEYNAMMKDLGYSYEKALEYAAQLGDVNAILASTAGDDKKTQALKAMALQYGATAEEVNGLTQAELVNVVTSKKWNKQAEASAKGLQSNIDKLKELKKTSSEYKSTLNTMAEQINVLGGTEGIVNGDWVTNHLKDIQAMANGDEAAAERVRKAWAKAYADSAKTAGTSLNQILTKAGYTGQKLEEISDQLYEFKITGKADFTSLYNSLLAVYKNAGEAMAALKQIADTNITLDIEYEYSKNRVAPGPGSEYMTAAGWEHVGGGAWRRVTNIRARDDSPRDTWTTPAFTNPSGTGGSSSSSSKEESIWENPYDRLYNLTQQINGEIRKRNRLESEYNRLVERGLGNASQLAAKTDQERKSLEQQKALQEQLLAERKKDIEKLNKNKYSKYAHYDMATGNVILNNDLISKNKDEDIGKGIEEQVRKLEELKSEIEGAEDALWDIEDQLYELTQRGRDEYIDFQKDVYNALIKQRQDEIDKYSEYISTLADAKNDILDELRKYIDKQRQERDNAEKEKEIADKDAQLFRMERDTGSTQSDIIAARKDVEQMRRDYTDDLIDQKISELEEQNDEAQKIREKQLETMQKQLEQDQKSGALWEQVKVLMEEGWGPDGKIIEGSELERILADYYEYTQMSEEERAKAIEQRNMNTTLAKQYLDAKNAGKNTYKPSTSYPDINKTQTPQTQTPKKNPSSNSGAKTLAVGTRVRTVGYGNAASDGSGGRAAKGLSGRKILKVRKGAKYPYLIGTSNDPSGWTGWYTASALQAYKKGGLANFTGPAWLDGTKTKPEAVLNARDTQNFLQLRDVLSDVLNKSRTIERSNSENNGDNYYDIDIQVDKLSNDYDVDQLVKKIKKEITKDANYRNVRTINLKR
uniref:Minor tail protein n=1 Tax=Siphoviridae sp. ctxjx4 TaxID=2826522 RepID=A0A8S5M211_9CAUD|nr:MAG TPA: minor tail protein [Siphoviridae sp. ctxjx4]